MSKSYLIDVNLKEKKLEPCPSHIYQFKDVIIKADTLING